MLGARPTPRLRRTYIQSVTGGGDGGTENIFATLRLLQGTDQKPDLVATMKKLDEKHDLSSITMTLSERNPDGFNTMIHGDAWFNNALFKWA